MTDGPSEVTLAAIALIRAHLEPPGVPDADRRLLETISLEVAFQDDPLLLLSSVAQVAATIVKAMSALSVALEKPVTAEELLDSVERGLRGESS